MRQTMEEYESNESERRSSWIWSKAMSVGKKVLTAGVVVFSAPLLIPSLIVASTIAFIFSVPFCLFLANYACTQKVMSSLLPANEETGGSEKDESEFEDRKIGLGDGTTAKVYEFEPILTRTEEDEEMKKESTSLIEGIRDEGITEKDDEKSGDAESEKVQDQSGKHEETETGEELGAAKTENVTGKDEETSSNEVYNEEQMWEKMEALRKAVGYSVARSATYGEELKALYVFTGVVEPPRMNTESHEIANASVRLRFLMSVFGIK